jgi:hypothetical protein
MDGKKEKLKKPQKILSVLCPKFKPGIHNTNETHYTALHSLDPELVKMTVGCGICHVNIKTYLQYN